MEKDIIKKELGNNNPNRILLICILSLNKQYTQLTPDFLFEILESDKEISKVNLK